MTGLDLNKRYLIIGAGVTGQSVVRYFQRCGASFALVDSRHPLPALDQAVLEGVEVFSGSFTACLDTQFDVLVVSPGVSLQTPEIVQARQRGAEIIGDIELFARAVNARAYNNPQAQAHIVAVTGANGKSTVVSMLGEILAAANINVAVGGNLGPPALDLLDTDQPSTGQPGDESSGQMPVAVYVLELSSFQLETTYSLQVAVASVLNISEDHMDRYTTLDEYARVKRQIYRHAQCCVYNAEDPLTWPDMDKNSLAFARNDQHGAAFFIAGSALMHGDREVMSADTLGVPGGHNAINALTAIALSSALVANQITNLAVADTAIRTGLQRFTGLPHRTELIAEKDGVGWYNDSKGTNVGATLAAITGMSRPVVLIAGGDGKGADFSPLAEVAEKHLRAAVLIGRDGPLIEQQLHGKTPVYHAADMHAAVGCARQIANTGDNVLLSPACASFDMYRNYTARGDAFVAAVKQVLA